MARARELIEPHKGDKRLIRRNDKGQITKDQVDLSRSLRKDVQQPAKTKVKQGQGDKGDRPRAPKRTKGAS